MTADPGEWAAKAAQWAQHRQMQEQAYQHMSHWQHPVAVPAQPPQPPQPMLDGQFSQHQFAPPGQEYGQPPAVVVPPQGQLFAQQQPPPVHPEQLPHAQPRPLMESLPPQHGQAVPPEGEPHGLPVGQFERPRLDAGHGWFGGRGEGRSFGGEERHFGFLPRGEFAGRGRGGREHDFRPRGGGYHQADFRHQAPRGVPRPRGPVQRAGLGYRPSGKSPKLDLPHHSPERAYEGDAQPTSPTEQYFMQDKGAEKDSGGRPDFDHRGGYSLPPLHPSVHSAFRAPGGGEEVRLAYKDEREDYETEQFREVTIKEEREEDFEGGVDPGEVAAERQANQEYIGELEQLGEEMAARDREQEEWRWRQEQGYGVAPSRGQFSSSGHVKSESPKPETFHAVASSSSLTGLKSAPPRLSKLPSVIPGLGEFERETPAELDRPPPPVAQPKDDAVQPQSNTNQTTQMMESLGKIVSQLQTLQGLTSSLQLLQNLPKVPGGQQEGGVNTGTRGEAESAKAEVAQKERENELSEETKRKVAALLANDSDSDGEQVLYLITANGDLGVGSKG